MPEPYEEVCSQDDVMTRVPAAPVSEPEVCEDTSDPTVAGPTWPEATDPEIFGNYAEVCDQNGGGGAGGAPNTDTGAEGAGGVSNDGGVCEEPQTSTEAPAETPAEAEECRDDGTSEEKTEDPAKKKAPSEMTPEEREADRTAKMDEYAKQSQEEKEARWAKNDGKLSQEAWDKIQKMKPEEQKQAMLQAGIDKLDYDDPRRAQLEKIQHWMGGKDSVTPGSQPPDGETQNLLTKAGRTGGPDEAQLKPGETRCGEVAGQMLGFTKEKGAPGLPTGGYFNTKGCEADDKNATPGSGDIVHLRNEAKNGKPADDNGHASMFVVSSPDGTKWLTFDGGQGPANGDKQKIALSMRNVTVDDKGRTMVSGADQPSANPADNGARAVSRRWDYEKMHKKYLSAPAPTQ